MNSAQSILMKEIWSRRTDKRILWSVVRIVLALVTFCLAVMLYEFVTFRWLTPSGRRKAQQFIEQSEKVRFGSEEEVKRSRDSWDSESKKLDWFTVANRGLEVRAQLLIMDAENCRLVELRLPKIAASARKDWLVKLNQQQCKKYEQDVKSLRESLQNAPAFQISERQDLWQRTLAK